MSTLSYRPTSNGTGGNIAFTIDSFSEGEIEVYVDGTKRTNGGSNNFDFTIPDYTATGGTVTWNTSGSNAAPTSSNTVRIQRRTKVLNNANNAVEGKATYSAGAAVKATDLNNNTKQALRAIQEKQDQLVQTYDIEPDAITNAKIADNSIDSEHYVDGSIDRVHLEADIIDGSKIEDNAVNHEHIAPNAVRTSEIQNSAVNQDKLDINSVGTPELINGSVNSDKILNGTIVNDDVNASAAIAGTKISPDFGSQNIQTTGNIVVGGTVDGADVAAMNTKLTGIEDGATADQTASDIKTLLQSDKLTASEIATGALDGRYFTETELNNGALDGRYFTETESDARYFNISSGETIKDGDAFPDNDTTIATTAAINDRIIDLVDDIGGFVPIANELSFPNSNPDLNDGAGTLISIKALSTNRTANQAGELLISNGTLNNSNVFITGLGANETLPQGFGLIVESSAGALANTYTFHRLVPKATEVTTVASNTSNITTVVNNISSINAVAADASDIGIVAADGTDIGLVAGSISNVNTTAGSIANVNTVAGSISNVNSVASNISNVNSVASNESNINSAVSNASNINSAVSNASNINTVAGSISNVNTTAGSIANVNSVASNMANVNNFADRYQIAANNPSTDGGGNALAAGDLYFNTSANELKVYTGSAWQGGVTATGNFAVTTGNTFTGDNTYNDGVKALFGTGSDLQIYHTGSHSYIEDNGTGHLYLKTNGDRVNIIAGSENTARFNKNGAVELYYDNVTRLETTSTGVTASGTQHMFTSGTSGNCELIIAADSDNSNENDNPKLVFRQDGNLSLSAIGHNFTGNDASGNKLFIANCVSFGGIEFYTGDSADAYTSGVKRLEITSDGNLQIPNDSGKLQLGTSQDLEIFHNGNDSVIKDGGTGSLNVRASQFILQNDAGTENIIRGFKNGAVELYYDNSKKLETLVNGIKINDDLVTEGTVTFNSTSDNVNFTGANYNALWISASNAFRFNDNAKALFGTGNDLEIFHNGSASYIQNTGTTGLNIHSNNFLRLRSTTQEAYAVCTKDGSVDLYYDNSKKFETTSTGVTVTGDLTFSDSVANDIHLRGGKIYGDDGALPAFTIQNTSGNANHAKIIIGANNSDNGGIEFYGAGSSSSDLKMTIRGNTDRVEIPDNHKFACGDGADLQLYHNGTNSYIDNNAGSLIIDGGIHTQFTNVHGEDTAKFLANGAVELYYDNSKKLETISTGANITGRLGFNTTSPTSLIDARDTTGATIQCSNTDSNIGKIGINVGTNENFVFSRGASSSDKRQLTFMLGNSTAAKITTGLDFIPAADSAHDLGSNTVRWQNIYADTLYGDGSNLTGISSVGGSTGVSFNDDVSVVLGTGNDTFIRHVAGSHTEIDHQGSGDLILETVNGGDDILLNSNDDVFIQHAGEAMAYFRSDADVELYYDNAIKLETTSTGVSVTGKTQGDTLSMTGSSNARAIEINPGSGGGSIVLDRNGHITSLIRASDGGSNVAGGSGGGSRITLGKNQMSFKTYPYVTNLGDQPTYTTRLSIDTSGNLVPGNNNSYSLGTSSLRWSNVFTADLNMSNKGSSNDVDGTWGDYTLQEGESDLFLINNRSGKKYKFNLTEVS